MKLNNILLACAIITAGAAVAQEVKSTSVSMVEQATCAVQKQESVVGAGVGGLVGAAAGGAVASAIFGKRAGLLGTLVGGAGGAMAGNSMGGTTLYFCDLLVSSGGVKNMVKYQGNSQPVVGKQYKLYHLTDGSVRIME